MHSFFIKGFFKILFTRCDTTFNLTLMNGIILKKKVSNFIIWDASQFCEKARSKNSNCNKEEKTSLLLWQYSVKLLIKGVKIWLI